ncbi:ATP-dependent nuclease [Aeromonas caviae]|uniref:ATP-dependent nuclease n=1 Tax=Aeromonas caviae TaxID=648 RepID=UPI0029D8FDCB|nr:AAA family ATPase [Aeromonas caviae]MDX7786342.1 AAA family ATPase [Aeromonas caviae]
MTKISKCFYDSSTKAIKDYSVFISKLTLRNYRNFINTSLSFNKGVNTIVGENGAGKTNIFRAIRLLLDDNMFRSAFRMDDTDFHRGLDDWRGHWIIISLEFDEIGHDEAIQALFLHGTGEMGQAPIGKATYNLIFRPKKDIRLQLAALDDWDFPELQRIRETISIEDYETIFTGRSSADFSNPDVYRELVGDFDNCSFRNEIDDPRIGAKVPSYLSVAKEVSFTFIQALRDVVSEFHNSRTNPLLTLLKVKSGEINPTVMAPIVEQVLTLNRAIETLDDVQAVRADIRDTIKDAAGETYSPSSLSIKSDLPDEADKLFQSLRLFVGESEEGYEGAINELSLGGANLIFLTLKLLEFKYQKAHQAIANFLIIEEPEAHIHTHIQKTLFDRISYSDTQIIYSTHSTHLSEVSNIQNINILGRNGNTCEAYQPATGLSPIEIGNIQRYLDAVRSNLLFAKSVLLIEGDAEEILLPVLFKKVMGLSLDELGISLINIRSTGFKNVASLFHDTRIKKRCSIITDLDTAFIDTTPVAGDSKEEKKYKIKCENSQIAGAARKLDLDAYVENNPWLSVHYAEHTFEVDFISAGNGIVASNVVSDVYVDPPTIRLAREELTSGDKNRYGRRILTMANNQGKGWFSILLGKHIGHKTILPRYIADAIFFACPNMKKELFFNIFSYRINCAVSSNDVTHEAAQVMMGRLEGYRSGNISLIEIKRIMAESLPGDQIHRIIAGVA